MRRFVPVVEYSPHEDGRDRFQEQFGGLPVGIDDADWPRCADCGNAMSHICQLAHHPERLDLGASDRVLTMWMCEHDPGMCQTWDADSGANRAVVSTLTHGGRALPSDAKTVVHPCAVVARWAEEDDGVPESKLPRFFDDSTWFSLPDGQTTAIGWNTRLGGAPTWIQSAEEGPPEPFVFCAQFGDALWIAGSPPAPGDGAPPKGRFYFDRSGDGWWLEGPIFGDAGNAYLFIDRSTTVPRAKFFWQCS